MVVVQWLAESVLGQEVQGSVPAPSKGFFKRTHYSKIYLVAALSEKELGIKNLFAALLNLALGQKSLDQTRIDQNWKHIKIFSDAGA